MRFLADMGVSVRVVEWLRKQQHDATHLREEGLQRLPNGEIFSKAIEENRIILTFDLDFAEIAALSAGKITSVVVFRLSNARSLHLIERLTSVLPPTASALEKGAIITIEEARYRVRSLPIGKDE